MRRGLKVLTKPYILGLLTTLFLVSSVALMSRPLFIPNENAAQTDTATTSEEQPAEFGDLMAIKDIQELASADGTGGEVEKIELHGDSKSAHYIVGMSDGEVFAYDAISGEMLTDKQYKIDDDDHEVLPKNYRAVLNFSRARAVGLEHVPEGVVKKIELHVEDGTVVYVVRFNDNSRVTIDADNGNVTQVRIQSENSSGDGRVRGSSSTDVRVENNNSQRNSGDNNGNASNRNSTSIDLNILNW